MTHENVSRETVRGHDPAGNYCPECDLSGVWCDHIRPPAAERGETVGERVRAAEFWRAHLTEGTYIEIPRAPMGNIYLMDRLGECGLQALCAFVASQGLPAPPPGMYRRDVELTAAAIIQPLWWLETQGRLPESVELSRGEGRRRYKQLCEQLNSRGGTNMAADTAEGTTKAKATRTKKEKVAKPKKEKTYLIVRYTVTAKDAKKLADAETKTQAGLIYRFIRDSKEPPMFQDILTGIDKRSLKTETDAEGLEANFRWYINDLKKKGLIKSVEDREPASEHTAAS